MRALNWTKNDGFEIILVLLWVLASVFFCTVILDLNEIVLAYSLILLAKAAAAAAAALVMMISKKN